MYEQADFEKSTFDVTAFVDALVENSLSNDAMNSPDAEFDSAKLYSVLSQTMTDLEELNDKMQNELKKQQAISQKEIQDQINRVADLEVQHKSCSEAFIKLENDIMEISKKLVALGDQLENISQPHTRISEAKFLIANFNHFMRNSFPKEKFVEEDKMLPEYVDLLTKMKLVLAELDESKFQSAAGNIQSAHKAMEELLSQKFALALDLKNIPAMSKYAQLLNRFESYSQNCVAIFLDELLEEFSTHGDYLLDRNNINNIVSKVGDAESQIQTIFTDPETIFATYLARLFGEVIQADIDKSLEITRATRNSPMSKTQLERLSEYEGNMKTFCDRLLNKTMLVSANHLNSLRQKTSSAYLNSYIRNEKRAMTDFCQGLCQRFYATMGHVKKTPQQLKAFGRKPFSENHDFPNLVFQDRPEMAEIKKEVESSINRASQLLTSTSDKNDLGNIIFETVLTTVFDDNLFYALQLTIEGTPSSVSDLRDLKAKPTLNFFKLINRVNVVVSEFNRLYAEYILFNPTTNKGLVANQSVCEDLRQTKLAEIETLINNSIDKTLSYYSAWIKKIYANQNSREYQLLDDDSTMHGPTDTCKQVCSFAYDVIEHIKTDLSLSNETSDSVRVSVSDIYLQFGMKLHSNLLNQIQRLQFSLYGGIQISMDLSEYKKLAENFSHPLLPKLFSSLHALCNLLITPVEHLPSVINGPELDGFEQNVVHDFVKLRVDYRRSELSRLFASTLATSTASSLPQTTTSVN